MSKIKSLILGSAASLVAIAGAQAADLPVKAKAVEYVKVCSLYGAGFYYMPGTDTCLKIGGYTSMEGNFGQAVNSHLETYNRNKGLRTRDADDEFFRARFNLSFDVRQNTEYGVLRSFILWDLFFGTSNAAFNSPLTSNTIGTLPANIYIQFAGFTLGKAVPVMNVPYAVLSNSATLWGYSNVSGAQIGSLQGIYTADLGGGLSVTAGFEDASYGRNPVYDAATAFTSPWGGAAWGSSLGGQIAPSFVARAQLDQVWGGLFGAVTIKDLNATYYATGGSLGPAGAVGTAAIEQNGHPNDKIAWGIIGAAQLKSLTGPGDTMYVAGSYGDGVTNISGNAAPTPTIIALRGIDGAVGTLAYGPIVDAVFGLGGQLEKTKSWGFSGGIEHYWVPGVWRTSLYGAYAYFDYNANANALLCGAAQRPNSAAGGGVVLTGSNCDFDMAFSTIGSRTVWTPVKGLDISAEVQYTHVDQKLTGTITPASAAFKAATPNTLTDQNILSGQVRIIRVF